MEELVLTKIYRRTAISFVFVTIIFLGLVSYVVLPQAVITVFSSEKNISEQFIFEITSSFEDGESTINNNDVTGKLIGLTEEVTIINEKTFSSTGSREIAEGLSGTITIHNTYSKPQTLVATTRFLTDDGVQLRLSDTVSLNPDESVSANVILDPSVKNTSSVLPGRLTIPGLWEGVQTYIYGEVTETITGPTRSVRVVSQEDIDLAYNELRLLAEKSAEDLLSQKVSFLQTFPKDIIESFSLVDMLIEDESWFVSHDVDTEIDVFTVRGTFTIVGAFIDESELQASVLKALIISVQDSHYVIQFDKGNADISFDYHNSDNTPVVTVLWEGTRALRDLQSRIQSADIVGLTAEEARNVILSFEGVEDIVIALSPFWVKKVPKNISIGISQ